jgi:xanthine dehydrogenase YagS FAD-binding subunit
MHDFALAEAADAAQAVAAARDGAAFIAGGTELLNWMRLGIAAPARVVDLGRATGLDAIDIVNDNLRIGALATLNAVGAHPLVREHATVLAEACLKAASAQVRERATLGGNVLQKTRCAYFRSAEPLPWGCNKRKPGSGCAARDGLNERHAILGWTDACVATQPSDPAVALACLDAEVELLGPKGTRRLLMTAFHLSQAEAAEQGAQHAAERENRLEAGELIVAYHLPRAQRERSAYVKVRERESFEYALVSAAAALQMDGNVIRRARIALGSVAQRPWRLTAAEAALVGQRAERASAGPAIEQALAAEARPLAHNGYKVALAAQAALRAVLLAGGVQ